VTREQVTWLGGGLSFGFIAGVVLADAMTAPTTVNRTPAPPPPAMGAAAPTPPPGAPAGDPHADMMSRLAHLREHLEKDPGDVAALLELAEIYLQAGMTEQALDYLAQVEKADPGNFQARLGRVMILEGTREGDGDSRALIEALIKDAPERWEPQYLLTLHLLNTENDRAAARRALERLEEMNPTLSALPELRREADRQDAAAAGPG
jgi:cytochrome c-type biogenesis protein CcmH/NrfG